MTPTSVPGMIVLFFDDFFHKFYNEIFFPYLKEHNIKTLIHLGDVVDRRKFINFRIAHNFRHKVFTAPMGREDRHSYPYRQSRYLFP